MSHVVALLEKIGRNSRLHSLTGEQLAQELSAAEIEPAVQAAILQQRAAQLEELIGASRNVCCLIHAPQDEEPEDSEPQDDENIRNRGASAQHGADHRVAGAA